MCTIVTIDKPKYEQIGSKIVLSRIAKDAQLNDDGCSMIFLDPLYPTRNSILRTMSLSNILGFVKSCFDTGSEESRIFIHMRAATTSYVGVGYTHGFDNYLGVAYMHNGVIDNKPGYAVDSFNLTFMHHVKDAQTLWEELYTADEKFANVFRINLDKYEYGVVRMAGGSLHTDGSGNFSTNPMPYLGMAVRHNFHEQYTIGKWKEREKEKEERQKNWNWGGTKPNYSGGYNQYGIYDDGWDTSEGYSGRYNRRTNSYSDENYFRGDYTGDTAAGDKEIPWADRRKSPEYLKAHGGMDETGTYKGSYYWQEYYANLEAEEARVRAEDEAKLAAEKIKEENELARKIDAEAEGRGSPAMRTREEIELERAREAIVKAEGKTKYTSKETTRVLSPPEERELTGRGTLNLTEDEALWLTGQFGDISGLPVETVRAALKSRPTLPLSETGHALSESSSTGGTGASTPSLLRRLLSNTLGGNYSTPTASKVHLPGNLIETEGGFVEIAPGVKVYETKGNKYREKGNRKAPWKEWKDILAEEEKRFKKRREATLKKQREETRELADKVAESISKTATEVLADESTTSYTPTSESTEVYESMRQAVIAPGCNLPVPVVKVTGEGENGKPIVEVVSEVMGETTEIDELTDEELNAIEEEILRQDRIDFSLGMDTTADFIDLLEEIGVHTAGFSSDEIEELRRRIRGEESKGALTDEELRDMARSHLKRVKGD